MQPTGFPPSCISPLPSPPPPPPPVGQVLVRIPPPTTTEPRRHPTDSQPVAPPPDPRHSLHQSAPEYREVPELPDTHMGNVFPADFRRFDIRLPESSPFVTEVHLAEHPATCPSIPLLSRNEPQGDELPRRLRRQAVSTAISLGIHVVALLFLATTFTERDKTARVPLLILSTPAAETPIDFEEIPDIDVSLARDEPAPEAEADAPEPGIMAAIPDEPAAAAPPALADLDVSLPMEVDLQAASLVEPSLAESLTAAVPVRNRRTAASGIDGLDFGDGHGRGLAGFGGEIGRRLAVA